MIILSLHRDELQTIKSAVNPLEALDERLREMIAENGMDLVEKCCLRGGGPDWEDCIEASSPDSKEDLEDRWKVNYSVWFTEVVPSACSDLPMHENRMAKITFDVFKSDGEIDWESEGYEPESF